MTCNSDSLHRYYANDENMIAVHKHHYQLLSSPIYSQINSREQSSYYCLIRQSIENQNRYLNFLNNSHHQSIRPTENGLGTDSGIVCVVIEAEKKTTIAAKAIRGNMIHTTYYV